MARKERTNRHPGWRLSARERFNYYLSDSGRLFGTTVFREAAVLGGAALEGGPMTQFEKACDNAVNAFLDTARRTGFGSEVAVGYLAAEENAITTVRMVMTGLLSGIDPERLKERLRDTYV